MKRVTLHILLGDDGSTEPLEIHVDSTGSGDEVKLLSIRLPVETKPAIEPGWTPEHDNPAAELLAKFGPVLARVTNEGHDNALHAALALVESVIGRELEAWGLKP